MTTPAAAPSEDTAPRREYIAPPRATIDPSADLTDILVDNAAADPAGVAVLRKPAEAVAVGGWTQITHAELLAEVRAVAAGLCASGIAPGDRVGLLARTRYEWTVLDFAIWFAGGVTVPVYESSSAEQIQWILSDSEAVACIVETPAHRAAVGSVRSDLPSLGRVWTIDDGALGDFVAAGTGAYGAPSDATGVSDAAAAELAERRAQRGSATLATIIYTSGTMGRPKGCELTHDNLLFELRTAVDVLDDVFAPGATTLLFLPLAHVFARVIQIGVLMGRARLAHCPDIATLMDDLCAVQPTFLLAVPRVFEKVFNTASQRAHAESGFKGKVFDAAARTAIAYSAAQDNGGRPPALLAARHRLFDRLVYGKLRAALGGKAQYAISGGAPLGDRLGHFYRGLGLVIFEGYGLTETTAAACVNATSAIRLGTVGQPLPGVAVRIADDGEILIRGPVVMRGYWKNPKATAASIDADGWFATGDIGQLDADGFVRITGRKKEILVTAAGKNVAPTVIEDRVRAHLLVGQCVVVGDGRPFIAALITLDPEALAPWAEMRGKTGRTPAELATDPDVLTAIQAAIDDGNRAVSRAESVRKFRVLTVELTEQSGHLTPKMSLKRAVVMRDFAADVDALYTS